MNESPELPGHYPYTRGIHPDMYRGRLWTMRQYAGFGSAEESNRRYRYLLEQGITGLSVAFDLPTQMGMDSDHVLAAGEVGRVGVAICSLADMELLFEGIRLDQVTTSMTINSTAAILLSLYVLVAKRQGADLRKLSGTVQNDILKEYIARGTYIYPPHPAMRIVTDLFAWAGSELPEWNTISISGYHIREAGSTAIQELAFTMANAIAYIEAAIRAGLDVDAFAPRLSFFFNGHSDFLEEIAKYRAARRLYAHIMKERFGAKDPKSMMMRFHTQTAGSTLTAQQPDVNVVRVALQAVAAVLGGTQSLHTNSRDEALGLPTEESARLALRTQQIIAHENGITNVADPLGGSYYIEKLTDNIERGAREYIERIDNMGGTLGAIEKGWIQAEIQTAAYEFQQSVERGETVVVGVNRFRQEERQSPVTFLMDPEIERRQVDRLRELRASRDQSAVAARLNELETAARGSDNLMPRILAACEARATVERFPTACAMSSANIVKPEVHIIGGGLAGCEAAWQIARAGGRAVLHEMRPVQQTPAHKTSALAELVCSNSLKTEQENSAPWLLKEELRRLGSLLIGQIAPRASVPAGHALAVDREVFAAEVTRAIEEDPAIEIRREEITELDPAHIWIVASGPLTSDRLADEIARLTGSSQLYFYDSISPIVDAETIDQSIAFDASRYGKSLDGTADYLNCPFDKPEYEAFLDALLAAENVPAHIAEDHTRYFEACLPIGEIARRGRDTLRFGPMKPMGLTDPRTGRRPYAVVQLRQENARAGSYNLVGFQNHMRFGEQQRVLRMIPGLQNAEFLRFGQVHRNTYINAPALLDPTLQLRTLPSIFFAGQISGVEGYVESIATGLVAGLGAAALAAGEPVRAFPRESAVGSLCAYVSGADPAGYQPANITFDLLPKIDPAPRDRKERHKQVCMRALAALENYRSRAQAEGLCHDSPCGTGLQPVQAK